jgi:hypothetical protein
MAAGGLLIAIIAITAFPKSGCPAYFAHRTHLAEGPYFRQAACFGESSPASPVPDMTFTSLTVIVRRRAALPSTKAVARRGNLRPNPPRIRACRMIWRYALQMPSGHRPPSLPKIESAQIIGI